MTQGTQSYRDHVAPLLATFPADQRLGLRFVDDRIDLLSNSSELVQRLREYYRDFLDDTGAPAATITALESPRLDLDIDFEVKQPEPGKTSLKEQFKDFPDGRIVHKLKTGMVFLFGSGDRYAVGPCIENDAQVVNFINNTCIEMHVRRGALLFHAAGIAIDGKGLAIAGFSGAGKSTLALEIMCRNTDFVSNDRLMVQKKADGLAMTGVAKMPRVNPGTVLYNERLWPVMSEEDRARFGALPQEELWDLEHKYDAFIDTCFGKDKFTLQSEMAGLVLLNWKRDGVGLDHSLVDLGERPDLLPSFMKSVGLFVDLDTERDDETGLPELDASQEQYIELLKGCPVLEFTGGIDFQSAADICLEYLKKWS